MSLKLYVESWPNVKRMVFWNWTNLGPGFGKPCFDGPELLYLQEEKRSWSGSKPGTGTLWTPPKFQVPSETSSFEFIKPGWSYWNLGSDFILICSWLKCGESAPAFWFEGKIECPACRNLLIYLSWSLCSPILSEVHGGFSAAPSGFRWISLLGK
jgi:hypothetical protein